MKSYTQIPNYIMDTFPTMSKAEFSVTSVICRQTFGWHRDRARLTYQNFLDATGMSKATVRNGILAVEKRGFFARAGQDWVVQKVDEDGVNEQAGRFENQTKTVQKLNQNGTEIKPGSGLKTKPKRFENQTKTVQKSNQNGTEIKPHIKERTNKTKKSNKNILPSHYQNFESQFQDIPPELKPYLTTFEKITRSRKITNITKALDIAKSFFDRDIRPISIEKYFMGPQSQWNTMSFGKNGQVPHLGHLNSEFGNICAFVQRGCKVPETGQNSKADKTIKVIEEALRTGDLSGIKADESILSIVKIVGLSNIKSKPARDWHRQVKQACSSHQNGYHPEPV